MKNYDFSNNNCIGGHHLIGSFSLIHLFIINGGQMTLKFRSEARYEIIENLFKECSIKIIKSIQIDE